MTTTETDSDDRANANDGRIGNNNNKKKKDTCYECDTNVTPTTSVELHPCGHSLCLHCMIEQQALTKNEPSFLCPCGKFVTSHRHVRLSKQLHNHNKHITNGIVQETVVTFDYASDDDEGEDGGEDNDADGDEANEDNDDDGEEDSKEDEDDDEEEEESKEDNDDDEEGEAKEDNDDVEQEETNSSVRERHDQHITAPNKPSPNNNDEQPTKGVAVVLKTTTQLLEEYKHWSSEPAGYRGPHPVYVYLESMQKECEKGWLRREEAKQACGESTVETAVQSPSTIPRNLSPTEKQKIVQLRHTMIGEKLCPFHTRLLAYAWGKNPRQIQILDQEASVDNTFKRKKRCDIGVSRVVPRDADLTSSGITVPVPEHGNAPELPEWIRAKHPQMSHKYRGAGKSYFRKDCKMEGCLSQSSAYCGACKKSYCKDKVGSAARDITKCCYYAHICQAAVGEFGPDDPFHRQFEEWNKRRKEKKYGTNGVDESNEGNR